MGSVVENSFNYTRITTATTTDLTAQNVLGRIIIPADLTGTATIRDGAGTTIVLFPIGFPAGEYRLNIFDETGFDVVTSAADEILVTHRV